MKSSSRCRKVLSLNYPGTGRTLLHGSTVTLNSGKQKVSETQSKTVPALSLLSTGPEALASSGRQSQEMRGKKLRKEKAF